MSGIAISGRAGSGKSTLAKDLRRRLELLGRETHIVSFADPIKREVWELYGIKKEDLGGRQALIDHGELKRATDPLYWVKRLEEQLAQLPVGSVPIIDDLRFPDEFQWLSRKRWYRLRIVAPVCVREARLAAKGLDSAFASKDEPTESALDDYLFDRRVRGGRGGVSSWEVTSIVSTYVTRWLPEGKKGAAA